MGIVWLFGGILLIFMSLFIFKKVRQNKINKKVAKEAAYISLLVEPESVFATEIINTYSKQICRIIQKANSQINEQICFELLVFLTWVSLDFFELKYHQGKITKNAMQFFNEHIEYTFFKYFVAELDEKGFCDFQNFVRERHSNYSRIFRLSGDFTEDGDKIQREMSNYFISLFWADYLKEGDYPAAVSFIVSSSLSNIMIKFYKKTKGGFLNA